MAVGDVNTQLDSLQSQANNINARTNLSALVVDNGSSIDLRPNTSSPSNTISYPTLNFTKASLGGSSYNYVLQIMGYFVARRDSGGTDQIEGVLEISIDGGGYSTLKTVQYRLDNEIGVPVICTAFVNVTGENISIRLRGSNTVSSLNYWSPDCVLQAAVVNAYQ